VGGVNLFVFTLIKSGEGKKTQGLRPRGTHNPRVQKTGIKSHYNADNKLVRHGTSHLLGGRSRGTSQHILEGKRHALKKGTDATAREETLTKKRKGRERICHNGLYRKGIAGPSQSRSDAARREGRGPLTGRSEGQRAVQEDRFGKGEGEGQGLKLSPTEMRTLREDISHLSSVV